ncbi:MAG: hypothetical protein WBN72_11590 [Nitrososphaeraceae archaeon]
MVSPYQSRFKARQQEEKTKTSSFSVQLLKDKPFWIWDQTEHRQEFKKTDGQCCFNHIVGLPTKDKREFPLFDYEQILFDSLVGERSENERYDHNSSNLRDIGNFKDKHLWVLKSTGLGITEFFLRLLGWLCTKDDTFKGAQACIVTGPNIDIAIKLIKRLKAIFESKLGLVFDNKETVLELNGCQIEAYPSNHIDSFRALANPKFIFIDEGDFFRKGEQDDVRFVSERYIGKSDPYIILVSTPNRPGSLFDQIEKEPEATCIYKRLKMDYTYGLNKIYSIDEINKARQSPSFSREYDLQYLGLIGNTFHTKDIDRAIALGNKYNPNKVIVSSQRVLGIDVGWGSSAFGICLLQVANGRIEVLIADEYTRPRFQDMAEKVMDIIRGLNKRNIDPDYLDNVKVYCDAANPEFITMLKELVGETTRQEFIQDKMLYCKKHNLDLARYMTVVPVPFNQEGKNMIMHCKELLEYERPIVAINYKFDKLITSLRTCISDDLGKINKEDTSYDDILDAFRLALKGIKVLKKEKELEYND